MKISKSQYNELCEFGAFAYELFIISENSDDERMKMLCNLLFTVAESLRGYVIKEK